MLNKNKISKSILIIEDDLMFNHQLKLLLEKQRFTVT